MESTKDYHAFTICGLPGNEILIPVKLFNISKSIDVDAVLDTGATQSAISRKLINELNLPFYGKKVVHTANSNREASVYAVNMILASCITLHDVEVIDLPNKEDEVLLGMDFISQGQLNISFINGKMIVSFVTPALNEEDYSAKLNAK